MMLNSVGGDRRKARVAFVGNRICGTALTEWAGCIQGICLLPWPGNSMQLHALQHNLQARAGHDDNVHHGTRRSREARARAQLNRRCRDETGHGIIITHWSNLWRSAAFHAYTHAANICTQSLAAGCPAIRERPHERAWQGLLHVWAKAIKGRWPPLANGLPQKERDGGVRSRAQIRRGSSVHGS